MTGKNFIVLLVLIGPISGGGISWAGDESESGLPVHRDIESPLNVVSFVPITPALTLSEQEIAVKVGGHGAVQIDVGADSYIVESCFSYPGEGNKIGWNGFPRAFDQPRYPAVAFQKGEETAWKPLVKQISADTISIEAQGSHYKSQRTIRVRDGKVDFEDKLTNLSKAAIGVVVRHGITADKDFLDRYNGGLEVAANPTVFLRGPNRSAALVMNDNVSRRRIRAALGASLNHSGVQILRFALDAGKTYTFSWSVYIMKEGQDYFDFINRLRKDWNANFAIDGPYVWGALRPEGDDIKLFFPEGDDVNFYLPSANKVFYINQILKDPEPFQDYLEWRGTKFLSIAPWLYHEPGAMDHSVTRDEYRKLMKRFVPLMHEIAPQVKILGGIETDWVSFRRENIEDSHRIPIADRSRKDGPSLVVTLDPDVSKLIEDSRPSWKNSFVRDAEGRLKIYTYYRDGKAVEQPPVCVFPEVGNARYEHMMDHIKLCIDELGMDGVYYDEFPLGQNGSRRAYGDEWDGLSAEVDFHTGQISGQYKDCSLAGVQARLVYMNYVLSKDKIVVVNRHSTTCAEQSIPAFRFTETGSVVGPPCQKWQVGTKPPMINYLCWSHLNSPLGLGGSRGWSAGNGAQWLMKLAIVYLRHGMVFYHYDMAEPPMTEANKDAFGIIKQMFPITPVELGEGFIVGKERILTAISMDRLWKKQDKPVVLVFDINGRAMDASDRYEVKSESGQWRVIVKLRDWSEIAVVK